MYHKGHNIYEATARAKKSRIKSSKQWYTCRHCYNLRYSNILFTFTPLPSLWQSSVWWATPVFVWREVWATRVFLAGLREKEYRWEQNFCQKDCKEIVQNDEQDTLDEKKTKASFSITSRRRNCIFLVVAVQLKVCTKSVIICSIWVYVNVFTVAGQSCFGVQYFFIKVISK